MSEFTVSEKRNRLYQRAFDHDEARQLRRDDPETWTHRRLADRYAVSTSAIQRVLSEKTRRRQADYGPRYVREHYRAPCKGGCGALVWTNTKGRSGLCPRCHGLARSQSVRPDTLLCGRCGKWKPDREFWKHRRNIGRRGRHNICKVCGVAMRRDHRNRTRNQERATENRRALEKGQRVAEFIVLQKNGTGFVEIGVANASSYFHAIDELAKEEGDYVAIPTARFQVTPVRRTESFKAVRAADKKE